MARIQAEIQRQPNSVFVSVVPPEPVKQAKQAQRFYRDWTGVAEAIASEGSPTPEPVDKTPEPKQTLSELLSEVDRLLYPERNPRVNTEPVCGYHYDGYTAKPKPDYDSGAFAVWNAIREKRNTEYLNYRASKGDTQQ